MKGAPTGRNGKILSKGAILQVGTRGDAKSMAGASSVAIQAEAPGSDGWARRFLRELLDIAIEAANAASVLPPRLPPPPTGRCRVVGAGKAAASMAVAVEREWPDADLTGCIAVPYGYGAACKTIRVIEAGHPVPDENSVKAARAVLGAVGNLGPDDLVLALISGGGSAALSLPSDGLSLGDKQSANRLLLASGLDIRTMNAARRRLSAIKGGKLAAAASPARVLTFAISDIPGDDPNAIASGPTAPPDYGADLSPVLERLGPKLPPRVCEALAMPERRIDVSNAAPIEVIATAGRSLEAAAKRARERGVRPVVLGDDIEGEAREVAQAMAQEALKALQAPGPVVLISGGETTVAVGEKKAGRGGRNTEFLLALAKALGGQAGIWALAADTDGEDGANLGAAGAFASPDTIERARAAGLDPAAALERHDSGSVFERLGDLVVTGPTLTNVNDFRAILVMPAESGSPNTGD